MLGTRKHLYFAGPGLRIGIREFIRYRLEYGTRMRDLGYEVFDPYAAFISCFPTEFAANLQEMTQADLHGAFLHAIESASKVDPYFRIVFARAAGDGIASIENKSLQELAKPAEIAAIHKLDASRVAECDALVAYLPTQSSGTMREVEVARSLGLLRLGFGVTADLRAACEPHLSAAYQHFDDLVPVLTAYNSGEGSYLTTSPVGGVRGRMLLYGVEIAALYPHCLVQVAQSLGQPIRLFAFCCERSHIHELAQKLPVMLRLGKITGITILTKDGSPHDVQMHTLVQEVVENVAYAGPVEHIVIEHGQLHRVSSTAVKASRHLHSITRLLTEGEPHAATTPKSPPCVGVLVGGQRDLQTVEKAGLVELLTQAGVAHSFEIVSSDREPERLRQICLGNAHNWDAVIAIAGGVPNLPIVVKSWLPGIPVVSVPADEDLELASAALTTPSDVPILLSGYGERGIRKAAKLLIQLLGWNPRRL